MIFCRTANFIAPAHGRVSSYVSIENGAASPGRWQLWQRFCKIDATSFVNVGAFILPICAKREVPQPIAINNAKNLRTMALCSLNNISETPSDDIKTSRRKTKAGGDIGSRTEPDGRREPTQ